MKKIVFCCLIVILCCGCNWKCHRTIDDPSYFCSLFITNATESELKITVKYKNSNQNTVITRNDTCSMSPGVRWCIKSYYPIWEEGYSASDALQDVLKYLYKDTMYVTNIETGDTLFAYTHADTNKYTTNFFNPFDWQLLGDEEDCEAVYGNFLFEIKE